MHLNGVRAGEKLVREADGHYGAPQAARHAHLIAAHVDEPTTSSTVDPLRALPWDDAAFYAKESNVVIPGSRSQEVFKELTHRYAFVGGTEEEYAAYFNRDLPADMWSWCVESEV